MMCALWVLFYPPVFVRRAIINIRGSFFVPPPPPRPSPARNEIKKHPWIRGVTPTVNSIEGIDTKLSMYQDLRDKLSSGIFAALVDGANLRGAAARDRNEGDDRTLTHLLKRAFEVFDMEGKGYVDEADLGRVMTKVTGRSMSSSDGKEMISAAREERSGSFRSSNSSSSTTTGGLSLSDFSQLFSRLGHEHYKRGDYVYRPGDEGDKMFFTTRREMCIS